MKKSIFTRIISVMLICMMMIGSMAALTVSAEEPTESAEPTIAFVSNNVLYGDSNKLMYAVQVTNAEGYDVRVILEDEAGNTYNTVLATEAQAAGAPAGSIVYVSERGVSAQNIDEVLIATAQVVDAEGNVKASATLEYSILEYLWERLTVCDSSDEQKAMYNALLAYADALDVALNYKNEGFDIEDTINDYVYVAVVEDGEVIYGEMHKAGDVITELPTSLIAGENEQIVWTIDAGTKTTMTAEEFAETGYTVTENAAVFTAEVVSNADIESTHTLVLGTENGFTNTTSYKEHNSTDGWNAKNAACTSKMDTMVLILNGKTSAVGSLTSPTLSTGIKELSFQYTNVFSESNGVDLQITIKQNDVEVATIQLDDDSVTQNQAETFTWTLDAPISGDIVIEIVNNSPSNNSSSNKDRVAIWDITWTGYTAG